MWYLLVHHCVKNNKNLMTKYQQFFQDMLNQNEELFDKFRKVHDLYAINPKAHQKQFDEIGRDVQDIIRRYENRLCAQTEGSGNGKYSTNLSEKFQSEVKSVFPKINSIGLE